MLHQVVSSVFNLMEEYGPVWEAVSGSEPVPTFGFVYSVGLEPINVNLARMIEKFQMGVSELAPLYQSFLPPPILEFLQALSRRAQPEFAFPDAEWVRTIFHFALACHRKVMSPEHLIKSLTPLYLGKVASFVIETWDSGAEAVERRLEDLCLTFENEKGYLVEQWKAGT
jgi:hypothetical protein